MNDLLNNLGVGWIWIAGAFLLAFILWGIIKALREQNPTRRKPDSSPQEIPEEGSVEEFAKHEESLERKQNL